LPDLEEIITNFEYLEEWEDRYGYVIELGKAMPTMPEELQNERTRVHGCVSQVWLASNIETGENGVIIRFTGDSDAMIVRGLIAIILAIYSGRTATEIQQADAWDILKKIGLHDHLTQQRSNGISALISRIKSIATKEVQ
jgi:cysteine desulfuration protein SufE